MSELATLRRTAPGPTPGRTWLDSVRSEAISFLKGDNNAPWAILAETVLGCVPIVGQVIDARDLIKGLAEVGEAPHSTMAWFNLVTAVIGVIPGGGDAVKRSARAVKSGTVHVDELLSLIRRFYKGDPEQLIREVVNPGKIVAKLDEVLTSPALRKHLSEPARKRIDFVRNEIGKHVAAFKKEIDEWLTRGRRTSANTGPAAKATPGAPKSKPDTQLKEGSKTRGEHRGDASPTTPNASTQRVRRFKSLEAKVLGVLGEHMADYHCQEVKGWGAKAPHDRGAINPAKLNDASHLVQLWPITIRGRGIDAVWKSNGPKPYAIVEAKASCDPTKSLRALLGEAKDKAETAAGSSAQDAGAGGGKRGKGASKNKSKDTIRQTNGKVTQMGHGWIEKRLASATGVDLAIRIKSKGYSRHVLFFSIPQAVSHAEALIKLAAKQPAPHEIHAGHQVTRDWGDTAIDKVVDNRAGLINEGRRR